MNGLLCLLNQGYIHRDIKPENILIKNKIFKLADFGLAGKIPDKNYFQGIISLTFIKNSTSRNTYLYGSLDSLKKSVHIKIRYLVTWPSVLWDGIRKNSLAL